MKFALKCRRGPWVSLPVPMSTRTHGPSTAPAGVVLILGGDEGSRCSVLTRSFGGLVL